MAKYRLSDIAPIIQGDVPKAEQYWLLNLDMVESNTGRIIDYLYCKEEDIGSSTIKFDTNNVLYSKLRPYLNKVVIPQKPGYATSEMLPLCPDQSIITREYLTYYLRSSSFVSFINEKTSGAKMPRANSSDLKSYLLECPSINEQQLITHQLDSLVSIIEKRALEIQRFDDLIKARFVEMFGNPITNSQNRPTTEFINVVKMQRGFDLPVQDRHQDGSIPVYGSNGALDRHDIAKIHGGGVITGRSGTIGKVFYTEEDYWPLNTSLFSVDTHGNNVVYLAYLLEMYDLSRFVEGTGVPTLNRNMFHNKQIIEVDLEEQSSFANFVKQVDKSKSVVQKSLDETQLMFDSLMQLYFG